MIREIEKQYWFRIGELKAEGLSPEQAREKIYQDILKSGDLEGAKKMRTYQDNIHPLKSNDEVQSASSS